jgi:multiple sugar transport system permease protein
VSAISELSSMSRRKGPVTEEEKRANRRDNKAAYIFLLPWLVGLVVITVGPMLMSLYLAFTDYNLLQPPEWTGLDNFTRMLGDARLHNSLRVTFTYVLVGVPLQLAVALLIALVLDKGLRGLPFYRSVFYLPSLLGGSVAVAILWKQIFGTTGLVNQVLAMVGIAGPGWISDPSTSLGTIILLHVWTFGSPMIIFLAGLRQIPNMYYEAAEVDGATTLQKFWRITFPCSAPSSSSTWCCRSSAPSSPSPRRSSSRAAMAGLRIPPCSSRCTSTKRASASSTWATPRPWPGSSW